MVARPLTVKPPDDTLPVVARLPTCAAPLNVKPPPCIIPVVTKLPTCAWPLTDKLLN